MKAVNVPNQFAFIKSRARSFPARNPPFQRQSPRRCPSKTRAQGAEDPYAVLGVARSSSFRAIKQSYYAKMRLLHPDVNLENDTTEEAVRLNAAYAALLEGLTSRPSMDDDIEDQPDVFDAFDFPEAEATALFVNPFACMNASPLQWEELQEVARAAGDDLEGAEEALRRAGAGPRDFGAVMWITPGQLQALQEELGRMGPDIVTMEACAFYLSDCLNRARVANARVAAPAR